MQTSFGRKKTRFMSLNINSTKLDYGHTHKLKNKAASLAGSVTGLSLATAIIATGRKHSMAAGKTKSLTKVLYGLEFNAKDVMFMATSSILGGLTAGGITDPNNINAKLKEGVVQLVGNYIFPSIFVGLGMRAAKSLTKSKPIRFIAGFGSLIAGVFAGNRASKEINSIFSHKKEKRDLNWKDWVEQADNACLVTSLANPGTHIAKYASKFIPVSHIIPGYCVGVKSEK